MIDPTACDWAGNNTSRHQRRSAWRFIGIAALIIGGLAFFTMILWSV